VSEAVLDDGDGNETEAVTPVTSELLVINTYINTDGKADIGDLGIIGRYYGERAAQNPDIPQWHKLTATE